MPKRIYNQTALFGELYAYLVVISPPNEVLAKIAAIKREMNAIADISERNLYSVGHITITDKLTDDPALHETIRTLISKRPKFNVRLSGIGHFDQKSRHTVFLKVENPTPIIAIMDALKAASKSPHLALAKKIDAETFDRLGPYLTSLHFSQEWLCEEVLVLRKLMSEKEKGFREQFRIALR